jgi:hypothetical protein
MVIFIFGDILYDHFAFLLLLILMFLLDCIAYILHTRIPLSYPLYLPSIWFFFFLLCCDLQKDIIYHGNRQHCYLVKVITYAFMKVVGRNIS